MKNDDEIIESLIKGGLIGASLGALLSKNKGEGASIGALIGAAILGTYKANEKARETRIPMVMEENGVLYQINADGRKIKIREIEKHHIEIKKNFKLK